MKLYCDEYDVCRSTAAENDERHLSDARLHT